MISYWLCFEVWLMIRQVKRKAYFQTESLLPGWFHARFLQMVIKCAMMGLLEDE